ncbi:MAG: sulfotransferase family protein, partial [Rhodobacteraceae bacterium]|nr:sulfotransferase family protein [Paracoccaceae bacterium]
MAVHLNNHGISYFSVPKCACTSLKYFFFEIENGFEFRMFKAGGVLKTVHTTAYPSNAFTNTPLQKIQNHHKFAVVRDPVSRVLSCYSNRVIHHQVLTKVKFSKRNLRAGMVDNPDLARFIRFFHEYRKMSADVAHHSRKLSFFLGRDSTFYDRLYNLSQLPDLVEDMKNRVGTVPELGRRQTGGPELTREDLSKSEITKIEKYFKRDIDTYGRY